MLDTLTKANTAGLGHPFASPTAPVETVSSRRLAGERGLGNATEAAPRGGTLGEQERERLAVCEAGRAIVAMTIDHGAPLGPLTLDPGEQTRPGDGFGGRLVLTKPELEARIMVALAGRAAEDLVFDGLVSTCAADGLAVASDLARRMVTELAMSAKLGQVTFVTGPMSQRTAELIDEEVRRIVGEAYDKALTILSWRRDELMRVTDALLARGRLGPEEAAGLVEMRPDAAVA
jgi:cell division protease FtsH